MIVLAGFVLGVIASLALGATPAVAQRLLGNGRGLSATVMIAVATRDGHVEYNIPGAYDADLFRRLSATGAGFVRLVTRPAPLLADSAADRERAAQQVLGVVAMANTAGLVAIVDLHQWPPDPHSDALAVVTDPARHPSYERAVALMAQHLAVLRHGSVVLEPFNEPGDATVAGTAAWVAFQTSLIGEIRRIAPTLPVIVTGGQGQTDGLLQLDVARWVADRNVLFSFHFYEPFIFTHQESYFHLRNVPFPVAGQFAALGDLSAHTVPETSLRETKDLARYLVSGTSERAIDARFDQVAAWAARNHIAGYRILLGEFGNTLQSDVARTNLRDDELRWLARVRTNAVKHGFAYAFWCFSLNPKVFDYDVQHLMRDDVLAALGLKPLR